jgi:single-stranded-DNA-specific exonuclease
MQRQYQWDILNKEIPRDVEEVVNILLENRDLKTKNEKEDFYKPKHPNELTLQELNIDLKQMQKAVGRIKKAIENKEHVVVYGDYDADGVSSTAIMWQALYAFNKNTTPFMPDRFIDGYGLHANAIVKLKEKNPDISLIVTVDNGIVANAAVDKAKELGVDVVITDHHQIGKKLPKAHAIVHTDMICGAGVAWIVAREVSKQLHRRHPELVSGSDSDSSVGKRQIADQARNDGNVVFNVTDLLDLAAIGTISDQMPLVGANRCFAKYGLEVLNRTKRCGLLALFKSCAIEPGKVGTYDVNYLIAPRINAMGRLESAMDSLRLVCTTNNKKAQELADLLGKTNTQRQKMVEEMVAHAKTEAAKREWLGAIVIAHETYHEGVIGLIASKLVEEYYRPAIVLSKKDGLSKASARSIHGFNVIENIRKLDHLLSGGGGHPMAAGFNIETTKIEEFVSQMETLSKEILTEEMLLRKLRVDTALPFEFISMDFIEKLGNFNPIGIGNPTPLFVTEKAYVEDATLIGADKRHVKMHLSKKGSEFEAIAFNFAHIYPIISPDNPVDIVYSVEENIWNGRSTIQLKIKDMKIVT